MLFIIDIIYPPSLLDFPPLSVVDDTRLLPCLVTQILDETRPESQLENGLQAVIQILLMSEGSEQRVEQVIAQGLLDRLVKLVKNGEFVFGIIY